MVCESCGKAWPVHYCPACMRTIPGGPEEMPAHPSSNPLPQDRCSETPIKAQRLQETGSQRGAPRSDAPEFVATDQLVEVEKLFRADGLTPRGYEVFVSELYHWRIAHHGIESRLTTNLVAMTDEGREQFDGVITFYVAERQFNIVIECKHKSDDAVTRNDVRVHRDRCASAFPAASLVVATTSRFDASAVSVARKFAIELLVVRYAPQNMVQVLDHISNCSWCSPRLGFIAWKGVRWCIREFLIPHASFEHVYRPQALGARALGRRPQSRNMVAALILAGLVTIVLVLLWRGFA